MVNGTRSAAEADQEAKDVMPVPDSEAVESDEPSIYRDLLYLLHT